MCGCGRYTYEMAPVFNLMEKEVLQTMSDMIGWSHSNGIFAPGGSVSNLYGVMSARHHGYPESRQRGTSHLPPLTRFPAREVDNCHCLHLP